MKSDRFFSWIQFVTSFAVVVGLILVIFELQQNREATMSQLSSDYYQILVQHNSAAFGENLADSLAKACNDPEGLTHAEHIVLEAYYSQLISGVQRLYYLSQRGSF